MFKSYSHLCLFFSLEIRKYIIILYISFISLLYIMTAIKEERDVIKLYKKSDICRSDGILPVDFKHVQSKYIPVEYSTPQNKKYSKAGRGIRYIKVEDLNRFINL